MRIIWVEDEGRGTGYIKKRKVPRVGLVKSLRILLLTLDLVAYYLTPIS